MEVEYKEQPYYVPAFATGREGSSVARCTPEQALFQASNIVSKEVCYSYAL